MPFDWKEYLEIAKHLQEQGNNNFHTEAAFRCAVSRSYYSAFCHAREYAGDSASQRGFTPLKNYQDHTRVRNYYKNLRRQFGITHFLLQRLQELRTKCDYDTEVDNPSLMASDAIKMAEEIFKKLQ